ncbi:MAG: DUF86 domain-containing protein [Muribaculaceae bacterium]|nr:DUF86 domain-containing protein [Muribaculaceae bacterium]MDE6294467.1 DUF86 domain-containing protein [Muribaculaceae bacterium]
MVHAYDTLETHMIWNIVINDIPKLKVELEHLLDKGYHNRYAQLSSYHLY